MLFSSFRHRLALELEFPVSIAGRLLTSLACRLSDPTLLVNYLILHKPCDRRCPENCNDYTCSSREKYPFLRLYRVQRLSYLNDGKSRPLDQWSTHSGPVSCPTQEEEEKSGYSLLMFCDKLGYFEDLASYTIDFGHEPTVVRGSTIY